MIFEFDNGIGKTFIPVRQINYVVLGPDASPDGIFRLGVGTCKENFEVKYKTRAEQLEAYSHIKDLIYGGG